MNSFTISGVPYRVLDLDSERGARTPHTEPYRPFTERALDEINQLPESEKDHQFLVAYSLYGNTFITADPGIILRLSLAGEVYNTITRKMMLCNVLAVFYRDGEKFRPLSNWELRHFKSDDTPAFLNKEKLNAQLKGIFKEASVCLGKLTLTSRMLSCPAWQINTEKGTYYLPWHNGALIENADVFFFETTEFNEIKDTMYTHLRFSEVDFKRQVYYIRSC